jgi:hypothetical protein
MALQYVTPDGVLTVPGSYASYKVAPNNSGLATTGTVFLVGEADAGPSYVDEGNLLYQNSFGPDQKADVVAKYMSGQVVDAYSMAVAASADPGITGSVNRIIIAKTNTSVKSSSAILALGKADGTFAGTAAGGAYGTLTAKSAGQKGNLISRTITESVEESLPTTGPFVLCAAPVSTTVNIRVNGGAVLTPTTFAQYDSPTTIVSAINAQAGVSCTGAVTRGASITGPVSVLLTNDNLLACHLDTAAFTNLPTVGDICVIPNGSSWVSAANEGTYVVISSVAGRVGLYKVRNAGDNSAVTNPSTETLATAAATDILFYSPVVITLEAGEPQAGLGKSLEIADATATFSTLCYTAATAAEILAGATPATQATFTSTTALPYVNVSPAEYKAGVSLVRQVDATNQTLTIGGNVILTLGYTGTTASAVISGTSMIITLTGGSSSALSPITIDLEDYTTINDLCSYLNTLGGFSAAAETASKGSMAPINLDDGTFNFATEKGVRTGRIKADGYYFATAITYDSTLVDIAPPGVATKLDGLPAPIAASFLAGGSRGATVQADIQGALDALKDVNGNFLVPLFSNDSAADISDGVTAATSSYTIDSINAACRSHVLQMSTLKQAKPRQALVSYWGTFTAAKNAAGNISQPRGFMPFQKVKDVDSAGTLKTFKPWAAAVKAAGMQAAGSYRDITGKFINISGIVDPVGYNNQSLSNREDALLAGLCPVIHEEEGGFTWVSDQTTYSADSNFLYNSLQAVYAADTVAATAAKRMGRIFKGQSLADVNAAVGVAVLGTILSEMKDQKWLGASDDAPKGYKNLVVKVVNGNALVCSGEIKIATGIKFIPISFLVTAISQTATG